MYKQKTLFKFSDLQRIWHCKCGPLSYLCGRVIYFLCYIVNRVHWRPRQKSLFTMRIVKNLHNESFHYLYCLTKLPLLYFSSYEKLIFIISIKSYAALLFEGTRKVKSQRISFPKCRRHFGKFVPSLPADSPATVTISGSPEQLQPEFRKNQVMVASWQSEPEFRKP